MNEERDLLAAEYVLGTLDAAERDAATRLRASDPDFDRAIAAWERRFAPLGNNIAPVVPSADVWRRILESVGLDGARDATTASGNVVVLLRKVARWRTATLATGALAAVLGLYVLNRDVLRSAPQPGPGAYVAAVNRGGDMPALIVRVDLATHSVSVRPLEAETPPGKSLELWYVASGQAPKSMGLVGKERGSLPMPNDMQMSGAAFAVSVEPAGGSPTGAPTGPVVYKGMLVAE